jgi:DNA recombination protein RmuC
MLDIMIIISAALSGAAALFAILAYARTRTPSQGITEQQLGNMLRSESERVLDRGNDNARELRQELLTSSQRFQETTLKAFVDLGEALNKRIGEFGTLLDAGVKRIDDRATIIANKLDQDMLRMAQEADRNRELLRQNIETKLEDAAAKQASAAKESREEITNSFGRLGTHVSNTLDSVSANQKERLEDVTKALGLLTEKNEKAQEALKQAVESKLDAIRTANDAKLEEMRKTVDEKLQSTLDTRLGQSFQLVSDQLLRVSAGLGEMQQLASGVGDLKRVLTQVRTRGLWGEVQLGSLLEDFLAPDQFARNVSVRPGSLERVEFAIRLPRLSDGHSEVYLPIDAKFPHEHFERVVAASEAGDAPAVEEAASALERAVRVQAKDIASKYIVPPNTTDYAVMFLPSEALYAELARRPGLVEAMTRESAVMIAGPSTLTALLNAIRVGFRSALIHQQAGEISKLLQKVRSEFDKYGKAIQTVHDRATKTVTAISELQTRQKVMGKALKGVDLLSTDAPIGAAAILLDFETQDSEEDEGGEEGSKEQR